MADRILIGKHAGGQLLRISQSGHDVKNQKSPMVFSSDNDYLRVHYRNKIRMDRHTTQDLWFYTAKISFPPLTYYPLVWYKVSDANSSDETYRFPSQVSRGYSAETAETDCLVGKNAIWFSSWNYRDISTHLDVDFIIFENRLI